MPPRGSPHRVLCLCRVGYHCDPLVVAVYDYSRRLGRHLAAQAFVGSEEVVVHDKQPQQGGTSASELTVRLFVWLEFESPGRLDAVLEQ